MKTAIYCFSYSSNSAISILIPKRKGTGYLVQCMGGHHVSETSRHWDSLTQHDREIGDVCDIDGYLYINLRTHPWDDKFPQLRVRLLEYLREVFPHIDSFKESHSELWKIILDRQK